MFSSQVTSKYKTGLMDKSCTVGIVKSIHCDPRDIHGYSPYELLQVLYKYVDLYIYIYVHI